MAFEPRIPNVKQDEKGCLVVVLIIIVVLVAGYFILSASVNPGHG